MKKKYVVPITFIILLIAVACTFSFTKKDKHTATDLDINSLPGATVLAFGPKGVLFIGDSKSAKVIAVETEAQIVKDPIPYNMKDFDLELAKILQIDTRDLIVNDMKIHPVSQEAYLAVKKGHAPDAPSMVAIVNPINGGIRFLEISEKNSSQLALTNPASKELSFWRDTPASTLTITDMDYYDGYLYVAGLSNAEFSSSIRKMAYPFVQNNEATQSIEVYHAVHTQMETRAPIRTMAISEIDGTPTLIASYTCTPLVTIPLNEISNGSSIKGKTIAELGYGNTPIDMITYLSQEQDGSFDQKLLITHKQRSGSLISMKDVAKAHLGKGLEGISAQMPTGSEGMNILFVPSASVLHIDNQNQMMVTMLERNIETGGLNLVSELKGVYLRLSDYISEYDFPSYRYDEKQEQTKLFHDMMKPLEGYPELVSEKMGRQ